MSDPQLADVARVCNRYPDIEVNFDVTGGETVTAGEPVHINVFMDRTLPEGQELTPVHCPRSLNPITLNPHDHSPTLAFTIALLLDTDDLISLLISLRVFWFVCIFVMAQVLYWLSTHCA